MEQASKLNSDLALEAQPPLSQVSAVASFDQQSQPSVFHWTVIVQGLDESSKINRVPLRCTQNGEQIWTSIRDHLYGTTFLQRLLAGFLTCFIKLIVGVGTIQEVHALSCPKPLSSLPVNLHSYQDSWLLTQAVHDPSILAGDIHHFKDNKRFTIGPTVVATELRGREAIVIRKTLDKANITRMLALLLFISPVLGFVIAVCTHKAEVGVAVSAGVFALASALQGLAAWFDV